MSTLRPTGAIEPKRARGRIRVQAILDAAAAVIADQGLAAATMTEIAARSHTAIGSLYRFFPTKDVLAEALSQRFLVQIGERLGEIENQASRLAPAALAEALLDLMLDLRRDKAAVLALLDVLDDAKARRAAVRECMMTGIAAILRAGAPDLEDRRLAPAAAAVMHILRGVSRLTEDGAAPEPRLVELRLALVLYLKEVLART